MTPSPPDWLKWALYLAERGFRISPMQRGSKEPFSGESWLDLGTLDAEKIKAWFAHRPGMNYGVSGVVLDLDVPNSKKNKTANGVEAFEVMELEHGELATFRVKSPAGGLHLYLMTGFEVGNAHLFPAGIDVRGHHGYVIGPGCELIEGICDPKDSPGLYTVIDSREVASAPSWVVARLKPPGAKDALRSLPLFELDLPGSIERARDFLKTRAVAVEGRNGDSHTYATVQHLKDCGLSDHMALTLLLEEGGWNERCVPQWERSELKTKVENAYRYGQRRPGAKGGGVMEMMDGKAGIEAAPDAPIESSVAAAVKAVFPVYTLKQLAMMKPLGWLIRDVIPESSIGIIYGATGTYKTFIAMSLGLSAAAGFKTWMESDDSKVDDKPIPGFKIPRKLRVAYVAGEGSRGIHKRVEGFGSQHKNRIDDIYDADKVAFYSVTKMPRFANSTEIEFLALDIEATTKTVDIVFIDTLVLAALGLNINDIHNGTGDLVDKSRWLSHRLNCTVIFVHHTGKDESRGAMGSQNLISSFDFVWRVERTKGKPAATRSVTLINEKMKEDEKTAPIYLSASVAHLGYEPAEEGEAPRARDTLTLHRAIAPAGANDQQEGGDNIDRALYEPHALVIIKEKAASVPIETQALAAAIVDRRREAQVDQEDAMTDGDVAAAREAAARWLRREAGGCLSPYAMDRNRDPAKPNKQKRWVFMANPPKAGNARR